mmetsp:Transcript_4993/g.16652  ORF Transcript_4993/g.16652 Transcript_4993/m.16652 type:complete len:415 (-) Transcript_4993:1721-2965(-)
MSDSSDGRASRPFVAALLVTVFGTMCVSEQKQKKLSAPLVGRRGGMGDGPEVFLDDINKPRQEYYFKPPGFVTRWLEASLQDKRDMPIAWLYWNIMVTMYPALFLLWALPPSNLLGASYLVGFNVLYMQRFILAMHYSTHKRLFKKGSCLGASEFVNKFNICVVAPVFGIPCNTYWLHHVVMHHVDNNAWNKDLSATEGYQRDSFKHWLWYWVRFMVGSWVELPYYAFRKKRWDLFAGCFLGMAGTMGAYAYAHALNPITSFWTMAAPFIAVSTAMMFGNWSQHAFIKPEDPRCNFGLAYTVLNHPDNQKSFNDGWHTLHHVNSQLHWSEFPETFVKRLAEHAEKDSLVFDQVGFFDVGFALFTGNHGFLADRYVNIGQKKRTREEVIALLKQRLAPLKHTSDGSGEWKRGEAE